MPLNFKETTSTSSAGLLTAVLLALSLVCFIAYQVEGETGVLHGAQNACSAITTPFQQVGQNVSNAAGAASVAVSDATADENTLSALRQQNEALRQQVAQLEEYRQEALRLESLLMVKSSMGVDGVSATVIGRSGEAYSQTITISAGSAQGVDVGMTVMGSTGVIGQVVSTAENTAVVRLLTDPQSGAAAVIQSSRYQGIVRGSLDGLLYLEDLDSNAVVNVGDVVLTSGEGGSYVSGLIIGTVVRIDNTQDISSQRIVVSPNDSVAGLQDVIVVNATGLEISQDATASVATTGSGDAASSNTAEGAAQ
ncbi:MAG: rod shape-determining protein MreC [Coriobacteriia bacterium]|nr:rod shape-determining protein MreC [Coriobacteriia bacterium]